MVDSPSEEVDKPSLDYKLDILRKRYITKIYSGLDKERTVVVIDQIVEEVKQLVCEEITK